MCLGESDRISGISTSAQCHPDGATATEGSAQKERAFILPARSFAALRMTANGVAVMRIREISDADLPPQFVNSPPSFARKRGFTRIDRPHDALRLQHPSRRREQTFR